MFKIKKSLVVFLLVAALCSFTFTAFAANEPFSFTLLNTGQAYHFQDGICNVKTYANNPATAATNYNNAPGWGFAFCMAYKQNGVFNIATVTRPGYWISGVGIIHPPYKSGQNITGRCYYVGARIDNDYSGPYTCTGKFNSDYTVPTF